MSMYRPKEEGTNEYVGSHSHIGKNFLENDLLFSIALSCTRSYFSMFTLKGLFGPFPPCHFMGKLWAKDYAIRYAKQTKQ